MLVDEQAGYGSTQHESRQNNWVAADSLRSLNKSDFENHVFSSLPHWPFLSMSEIPIFWRYRIHNLSASSRPRSCWSFLQQEVPYLWAWSLPEKSTYWTKTSKLFCIFWDRFMRLLCMILLLIAGDWAVWCSAGLEHFLMVLQNQTQASSCSHNLPHISSQTRWFFFNWPCFYAVIASIAKRFAILTSRYSSPSLSLVFSLFVQATS